MLALLLTLLSGAPAPAPAPAPKTGEELVRAMHDRYAGKWYKTLTFVQKTTYPDGHIETWYEAASFPGNLRIDIAPLDSGKAIIFRNDTIYSVNQGKPDKGNPLIHPLMVLGFDVYLDPAEKTIEKLKALKFDLTKLHTDTWQGKPVYVVGADSGDGKTSQFWIDQQNLLFVRLLRPTRAGGVSETQFNKYVKIGDAWLSPEVFFFANGQAGNKEEYRDWKTNVQLQPDLFDPVKFPKAAWIK
jgi:hypothetical protein